MKNKEVIGEGNRRYKVLSSAGVIYYTVDLSLIDRGLNGCSCLSSKTQCRHVNAVIMFESGGGVK